MGEAADVRRGYRIIETVSILTRLGIKLKPRQSLKMFSIVASDETSLFPHVKPVIPPGGESHLYDPTTGAVTPYTVPEGYGLEIIQFSSGANTNRRVRMYADGQLIGDCFILAAYHPYWESNIVGMSTEMLDPAHASSHDIDWLFSNMSTTDDLIGDISFIGVLTAYGTRKPKKKTVVCPKCGHKHKTSLKTTKTHCPKCKKEFWLWSFEYLRVKEEVSG